MNYLKITQSLGQIDIRTTPARMKIHSNPPRFKMRQKHPQMLVNRRPARMVIDKSVAYADRGNKTIFRLMDEFAQWANDVCAKAIERISAEGTEISRAGKNRENVVRQIILNSMAQKATSINVEFARGPDITWEEGTLEIEWIISQPEIEWEVNARVTIDVEPGNVEIYLRKHPSVDIEVVKNNDKNSHKLNKKI